MQRTERIVVFVEEIWKWYARHKRVLPWRDLTILDDTERAYQVLVSEIMLQQTQVERVKIVFKNFLQSFPKLEDLARAGNRDVLLAWRGMGYNSRALRLRDAAKQIQDIYKGEFPKEMEELTSIKGIGHYTAAAVRNFALNIPTPCLDTNIRRILHRVFVGAENSDGSWKKDDEYLLELAGKILDVAVSNFPNFPVKGNGEIGKWGDHDARNWHAALMDYGSIVCTKRNPKWEICPLTQKGIMKAAYKTPISQFPKSPKQEPGRTVGSTFIPNRIFRGKIVEELRDEPAGLVLEEIGRRVCIDWSKHAHEQWLHTLLSKLSSDQLVMQKGQKYLLAE